MNNAPSVQVMKSLNELKGNDFGSLLIQWGHSLQHLPQSASLASAGRFKQLDVLEGVE